MNKHYDHGIIIKNFNRLPEEIIEIFNKFDISFVSDCIGKYGAMNNKIKPLKLGTKICGTAVTCLSPERLVRRMAINLSKPGDILIVAAGGDETRSCFGGTTAKQMKLKGMAGVVIDGATRDLKEIVDLDFPTFCISVTPRNYFYPTAEINHGSVNVEVICGGVKVSPGDLIIGDDDGIVIVPYDMALNKAQILLNEFNNKKADRGNISSFDGYKNIEEELVALGYTMKEFL